jgi:multiple sugar transport system permease protein
MNHVKNNIIKKVNLRDVRMAGLFVLPLVTFITLLIVVPILGTLVNSLFQDVTFLNKKFIFLENYIRLFHDPGFGIALKFTAWFILVSVPLEIALGIMFALVLNAAIPMRGLVRACVLIPWAIPSVISARVWELVYNYNYGLANFLLCGLGLSTEPVNWLGTSAGAFAALVVADLWKTTPFISIIILAGLQTIPPELYEQAKIDRANFVQAFFRITLPLIKPMVIIALLFRTIDALRIFDIIYVLTGGGPGGTTSSVSYYASKYFLSGDFGYGCSISVVLFLCAFILSIVYIQVGRVTKEEL